MSLTTCLKRAGSAISAENKAALINRSRELRAEGKGPDEAAAQAVEEQIAAVQAMLGEKSAAPASITPKTGDTEAMRQAKADALKALGDLSDILGKPGKAFMTPEQEQKLLPVLTRLMDAAFRLGYLKFKDAARFALDQIRNALGHEAASEITIDQLQGAYIGMAGRYKDQGAERPAAVAAVDSLDQLTEDSTNASSANADLERLGGDGADQASAVEAPVRADGSADGSSAGPDGSGPRSQGSRPANDPGVPAGGAVAARERGDQPIHREDRANGPQEFDARAGDEQRGIDLGNAGIPAETVATEQVARVAESGVSDGQKRAAQRAAEKIAVKHGDLTNIRETLPYLLPEQQEDVHKAEQRFAKPTGYGMMFTNGTGTGKTFTGLGMVKRMAMQGKNDQLVVVPDAKIMADWIDSAKALGLTITPLRDTKDAGKGISITTYANLGENNAVVHREWQHVVPDEAHQLMQGKDGEATAALATLRAITLHQTYAFTRYAKLHADEIEAVRQIGDQITANSKIMSNDDTMDVMVESLRKENERLTKDFDARQKVLSASHKAVVQYVDVRQGAQRPRVTFLSATPFAYESTVKYAEGYLFDYAEGYPHEQGRGYNTPSPEQYFYQIHFGYRMKTGKLTKPDAKVDSGLMQRQFNGWLKKSGALSGRTLEVAADYDRRFVLVDSAVGNQIDTALDWISKQADAERSASKEEGAKGGNGFQELSSSINSELYGPDGHLVRRYLLEAIKAKEVVPVIKKHLELGRKVVVFHDFKKGGAKNVFELNDPGPLPSRAELAAHMPMTEAEHARKQADRESLRAAIAAFKKQFPDLTDGDALSGLISPIARFTQELPGTLLINGDEKPADLLARYKQFNDDKTGPIVALVQSAKNKGWSGHDTTGEHPRVLFNLGLPTQPTMTIQQEGRIYRVGQVSDAMFRYLNTGTTWERWAFAQTIARRASEAENLGQGEQARALLDAFVSGFEESDTYPPGHEGEGTGGKARDRTLGAVTTEWDRAKAFYYGTQKKSSKTKAQEGTDYFATPEPIGLKMVQMLDLRGGESALEPSAGHGAIARWLPDNVTRTAIEPSMQLRSRMALSFDGKILDHQFEGLHVVNKFDGIAMNPPFGTAGRTAIDHVAKAATHLSPGGRIAALIPTGPSADAKFDKWFYEKSSRAVKPLGSVYVDGKLVPIYKGDTVHSRAAWAPSGTVTGWHISEPMVKATAPEFRGVASSMVSAKSIKSVEPTGKRTEEFSPADGLYLIADIKLPGVTFERAGTGVMTRIVVLEKPVEGTAAPQQISRDYTDAKDINDLFDRIESLELRPRAKPFEEEKAAPADVRKEEKAKKEADRAEGAKQAEAQGADVVEYTTQKGKIIKGVIRTDLTQAQAKEIDPYTWKKDGGYFIRLEHMAKLNEKFPPGDKGTLMFSAADAPQPFYSELQRQVEKVGMNAAPAASWKAWLKGLTQKGVKADELEWTGVNDFLDTQQGKVQRGQLLDYLSNNGVKLTETTLGAQNQTVEAAQSAVDDADFLGFDSRNEALSALRRDFNRSGKADKVLDQYDLEDGQRAALKAWLEANDLAEDKTKYSQYTLPGGTNKREVLITLPKRQHPMEREIRALGITKGLEEVTGSDVKDAGGSEDQQHRWMSSFNGKTFGNDYKDPHWDQKNVVVHIRTSDHVDSEGKKVLVVEEIQSGWGQAVKKTHDERVKALARYLGITEEEANKQVPRDAGFQPGPAEQARFQELGAEWDSLQAAAAAGDKTAAERQGAISDEMNAISDAKRDGLPRAPFVQKTDAWVALALKRVIKMAVDEGYDRVAFVSGEQSAERYDLSKQIKELTWHDGGRIGEGQGMLDAYDHAGNKVISRTIPATELTDTVGKEVAQRLLDSKPMKPILTSAAQVRILSGLDLKVGGEGMKAFYDKIVPSVAKDVLRKLGGGQMAPVTLQGTESRDALAAKVYGQGETYRNLPSESKRKIDSMFDDRALQQPGFDITPKMREKASGGVPMFTAKGWESVDGGGSRAETARYAADPNRNHLRIVDFAREDIAKRNPSFVLRAVVPPGARLDLVGAGWAARNVAGHEPIFVRQDGERVFNGAAFGSGAGNDYILIDVDSNKPVMAVTGHELLHRLRTLRPDLYEKLDARLSAVLKNESLYAAELAARYKRLNLDVLSKDKAHEELIADIFGDEWHDPEFWRELGKGQPTGFKALVQSVLQMLDNIISMIAGRPFGTDEFLTDLRAARAAVAEATREFSKGEVGEFKDSPDISLSIADRGAAAEGSGWTAPGKSPFDNFVYKFQDKQIDLKRTVEAIKDEGRSVEDRWDAYLQEELFHGRAAKRTDDFVNHELSPLLTDMKMRGLSTDEVDKYLHARHAEEANKLIAERNKAENDGQIGLDGEPVESPLQDGGSGMTTADARAYLDGLDASQRTRLEAVAARVDSIIAKTRDLYVSYGLESKDVVGGWAKLFEHYVPLMREDKGGGMGIGQGFSIRGKEAKHRTGSTAKVIDILANIAMQREKAIVRGEKNRVAVALAGLAKLNPNPDVWTFDKVPTKQVFNERTGLVETQEDHAFKGNPNVLVAKILGRSGAVQERAVVFNEHNERAMRMAAAMKNLDAAQLEGLLGVSAKITRYFSAVNTQYNPVFGVVNLTRDLQHAALALGATELKDHKAAVMSHVGSALKGIYTDARAARKDKTPSSQWAELWEDFQKEGGQTGYREMFRTSADRSDAIQKALDPTHWMQSPLGKVFTAGGALKVPMAEAQKRAGWLFDWLSDYNEAMENAVRLSAYKVGLEQGMSKQRAASLAKNLTVNFNRKGQAGQQAGALYAFFNAAMQGTASIGRVVLERVDGKTQLSGLGKKIIGGGLAIGVLQALMLAAAGLDDDDPPQFVREKNLVIPIGGKKFLTIPMPQGFHVLVNLGRIPTEWAMGGFKNGAKHAIQAAGVFADAFNPVGSGTLLQTVTPTALDPLAALAENKDFTGRPIAKKSFNDATPGFTLARDTASTPAKLIAEAMNYLSGGSKYRAGVLSPTPDQIDYLAGQVTGGVGRELSKGEQTIGAMFTGEDLPPHKVPLLGRFYGDANSTSAQASRFYENVQAMAKHEAEIKGLSKAAGQAKTDAERRALAAERDAYVHDNPEAALFHSANGFERTVQRLRAEKRRLLADNAPRAQVKAIEDRITETMTAFNKQVKEKREPEPAH